MQPQDQSIRIHLDRLNNMCVVTAHGEIDLANHYLFGETLDQLDDGVALLLDLRGVQYMDSSALHVLIRTWDRHLAKHAPLAIVASPIVRRVCNLVGLGERVTFFSDIADALDHFDAKPR